MHLESLEKQADVLITMDIPTDFRMEGWVYVLSNPCMPGIYKVGMTTTSPETRARELSSPTGVPVPFSIEAAFYSHSPLNAEKEVHEYLDEWRVSESREFFEIDLNEILMACDRCCDGRVGQKVESIAVNHDLIIFEKLSSINLPSLFEDIGISVFGDSLAAAERLIRIGADTIFGMREKHGIAIAVDGAKAYAIEPEDIQFLKNRKREHECHIATLEANGIYGPELPVEF